MLEAGLHIRNLCDSKSHDCDHFGIFRDTWGTRIFQLKLVFTLNKKEIFSWNFYPDKLNNIPQEFAHLGCMSHCVCYHCNYKFLAMKKKELHGRQNMTEVDAATSVTSTKSQKTGECIVSFPTGPLISWCPILPSAASGLSLFPPVILWGGNWFIFPSELTVRSLLLTISGNCPG